MLSLTVVMVVMGANPKESPAELAAWIDAKLETSWRAKGLAARDVAGDEVFLRRVYLELTGTIPSVAEARDFLESTSANKRELLVRTLLDDKRFAEHTARQWARTLAPAGNTRGPLEGWLRTEFRKNTPFDQIARSVLTATGDANASNPASFYFAVGNTPERVAEAVGRGLLGVRLGCAQCHNHPFAAWTQEDFWGLAAFFAGTSAAPGRVVDNAAVRIVADGKEYAAKFLDGPAPKFEAGRSNRAVLADWLAAPENRFFAANVVNRVWQDLCGTGLVATVDDLDTLSPEARKEILDELAAKFAASGFNVRWLVEGICLSKAYQRASIASTVAGSAQRPVRTLSPEQVFASLDQSLGLKKGRGFGPKYTPEGRTLMAQLDAARGSTPTDFKGGIPQALLLMNGSVVTAATTLEESMTLRAVVDAPFLKDTEKLDTLYLAAYSRLPRQSERERMLKVVRAGGTTESRRQAYANVFWALLNSPEFVLCP
ncbi:MAG: DUF1549 domain-containing protein [Planctomycetes bacterium]|nr:DUF1549 domain-containing protein [Planctomycetota bacterium]